MENENKNGFSGGADDPEETQQVSANSAVEEARKKLELSSLGAQAVEQFKIINAVTKRLQPKIANGTASYEEKATYDDARYKAWKLIEKYAKTVMFKIMPKYRLDGDAFSEVEHMCMVKFYEMLPKYDPSISAPTTFFTKYFMEAISGYLRPYSQHLTSNDANNLAKIRRFVALCEMNNRPVNDLLIAKHTGLSLKVVQQTLSRAANSQPADIDEMINLESSQLSPEQEVLRKISRSNIFDAIERTLTPEELRFFRLKLGIEIDDDKNYTELSNLTGLEIHEVKSIWNRIVGKLQLNETIQRELNRRIPDYETLHFHEDTSDEVASSIAEALDLTTPSIFEGMALSQVESSEDITVSVDSVRYNKQIKVSLKEKETKDIDEEESEEEPLKSGS